VPVSSEPRTDADPGHEAFAPVRFERTPSTWLAYLLVGYFMYAQASLGPILPFLREDLSLGYGAAGLHFGAFALGVLFTGFCASLLLMSAQAALSDLHGEWRAAAISEANVVAGPLRYWPRWWSGPSRAPSSPAGAARCSSPRSSWRRSPSSWDERWSRARSPRWPAGRTTGAPASSRLSSGSGAPYCSSARRSSGAWPYWGTSFLEEEAGLKAADAATLMGAYFVALALTVTVDRSAQRHEKGGDLLPAQRS
jgi:hypothetical protein